jgi:hypothetical protein
MPNAVESCSFPAPVSRPVTYGITVSELGEDKVHEFQGKEPSGRKQSAIALDINSKSEGSML